MNHPTIALLTLTIIATASIWGTIKLNHVIHNMNLKPAPYLPNENLPRYLAVSTGLVVLIALISTQI